MQNSSMLWIDLFSLLCAAYCAYTWIRLLLERKLFRNGLLVPKEKSPSDCLDEPGYISYVLPRLGVMSLVLILYTGLNLFGDLTDTVLLAYPLSFLPLAAVFAVLIWYAVVSAKAFRNYF